MSINLSRDKAILRRNLLLSRDNHINNGMNSISRSRSKNFVYPLSEYPTIYVETIDHIVHCRRKPFTNIFSGGNDSGCGLLSFSKTNYDLMVYTYYLDHCRSLFDLVYFREFEKEWENALHHRYKEKRVKSIEEISIK